MKRNRTPLRSHLCALFVGAFLLAGCQQVAGPESDTWQRLEPGQTVEGEDGVTLAADPAAIDEAINVRITRTPAPEKPLPEEATAVSPSYLIAAEASVDPEGDAVFMLTIPVPDGADTDTLALAAYIEAETSDGYVTGEVPEWEVLDGRYDAAANAFSIAVYTLPQEGHRVQLISGATFTSFEAEGELASLSHGNFSIICKGWGSKPWCTSALTSAYDNVHDALLSEFTGMGFREPRLQKTLFSRQYKIYLREFKTVSDPSEVCERSSSGRAILGVYRPAWRTITLCVDNASLSDSGNLTAARARTARHEYVHAVQYAYKPVRDTSSWKWFIEGTAVAAEHSTATTLGRNNNRPLFPVDVPLTQESTAELYQYRAQDFFLYLGQRLAPGQGIRFLRAFLSRGAGPTEVSHAISSYNHSELTNLKHAYWAWAKNQAIEKSVDIGGALGAPCVLHARVATPITRTLSQAGSSTAVNQTLQPLTSKVMRVNVSAVPYESEVSLELSVSGANAWIKAYTAADCQGVVENGNATLTIPANTSKTLLILASNGEFGPGMTRSFSASLSRTSEPKLTIVQPTQTTYDEGDAVTFRADVTGMDPDGVIIRWTHERPGGPFTFGSTASGETITHSFCDGEHAIVASVWSGPGAGLEDSVTLTVNDLGATNPPPQCAPTITILEPAAGSTFGVGQTIPLRAEFSDSSNSATPRYPIVWRLDDAAGPMLGTGPVSATELGAGEHVIYVAYGAASDQVTITVIDTSSAPPTATITSPEDGATFSWWEEGAYGGGHTVAFSGTGSSPQGGELSLTWSLRPHGSSNWWTIGTGETLSADIPWSSCTWQWYEVRLEARDDEGLSGFDFIEIGIQPPPC